MLDFIDHHGIALVCGLATVWTARAVMKRADRKQASAEVVALADTTTPPGNDTSAKAATPPICANCAFHVPSAGGSGMYCTNWFVNSDREISVVTGARTGHAPTCEDARRYGGVCGPDGKRFKGWDPRQKPA